MYPQIFLLACLLLSPVQTQHPNVLLIIVDDLRTSLGCYGDALAVTPHMDTLAGAGVRFNNAYAQQALCGPSRTSLLTSRRPRSTHMVDVHSYWRNHANYTSMPEHFKNHGYFTASVGKIFHPGRASNFSDDQPYSWSTAPFHPSTQKYKNAPVCGPARHSADIVCPVEVSDQPGGTLPDLQSTKHALTLLLDWKSNFFNHSSRPPNSPFFLAVGFHKPHIPLKYPKQFKDLFPLMDVPLAPNPRLPHRLPPIAYNPWNDLRRRDDITALNLTFPYEPIPDDYARLIRQSYYAATSYTDLLIGELLAAASHLFPNTIAVLMGDHGWSLGEHQEWSKFSNFEVATKVPFIVSHLKHYKTDVLKYVPNTKRGFYKTLRKNLRKIINPLNKESYQTRKTKMELSSGYPKYQSSKARELRTNYSYKGIVELVDVFPTIADLVGIRKVKSCDVFKERGDAGNDNGMVKLCSEGRSLASIIVDNGASEQRLRLTDRACLKLSTAGRVAVSQYPRPSLYPSVDPDSDQCRLRETIAMGYSLRSMCYRYNLWVAFDHLHFKPNFSSIYAEELYDHRVDPTEDHNIEWRSQALTRKLRLFFFEQINKFI